MKLTVLGSGTPVPHPDRAGTSFALEIGFETVLIDCGPGTVERSMAAGIDPSVFERVFFTHQHMDHNASFFHFAVAGWMLGRRTLTLYGPAGTERLIEALEHVYEEDFEYRSSLGRPVEGLLDIQYRETGPAFEMETDEWRLAVDPVDHSIETHAFRFTELTGGASIVFSGDTCHHPPLAKFAEGADVLVHDGGSGPRVSDPPPPVWDAFVGRDEAVRERLRSVHSTPTEAATIAAEAGVDTLVLNHVSPYVDAAGLREEAEATFHGRVVVAEDLATISPSAR